MSFALVNHLLGTYGYLAVFVIIAFESLGLPLPGETTLIAASVYAGSTHRLNIVAVAVVWASLFGFGCYALGSTAASVSTTVTLVGLGLAGVVILVAAVSARRSYRRVRRLADVMHGERPTSHDAAAAAELV